MTFEEQLANIGSMKHDFEQIATCYQDLTNEELKQAIVDYRQAYYNGAPMEYSNIADNMAAIMCLRNKYGVTK